MDDLEKNWSLLITKLEKQFNEDFNLKGVLYLIGIQELNFGLKKYERHEKMDVIHVAVCKVLSPFSFYQFNKIDEDGWPHYKEIKAIKSLNEKDQEELIKLAILKYLS